LERKTFEFFSKMVHKSPYSMEERFQAQITFFALSLAYNLLNSGPVASRFEVLAFCPIDPKDPTDATSRIDLTDQIDRTDQKNSAFLEVNYEI
jgi:hypothetical protein